MSDAEFEALARSAQRRNLPISEVVRDSVRRAVREEPAVSPDQRIAAVLRFASFTGPTGDIDQVLTEIERGRGLR